MLFGSNNVFIPLCKLSDSLEKGMSIYSFWTKPIPCSPEIVPPNFTQRLNISLIPFLIIVFHSFSERLPFNILTCKLPSPA